MTDTATITCTVSNARPCPGKSIFAMVDVQIEVGGVSFSIQGVQARRLPTGGTSIHLPTFKDASGLPTAAIVLPDQLKQPLCDAVLAFLVDEQLAKPRA